MAGSKINDYSIGDSNIQSVMLTLDKAFKGFHQVSLTNYNTTDESAIAAGSVVEVNGALYKFDADESITGSPSDGTVYIYLVPSGDTVTAAYTNDAPIWSDSKQGWYGTGGNANYRYLEFKITKSSAVWSNKRRYKYDLYELNAYSVDSQIINSYYASSTTGINIINRSVSDGADYTYNFLIKKPTNICLFNFFVNTTAVYLKLYSRYNSTIYPIYESAGSGYNTKMFSLNPGYYRVYYYNHISTGVALDLKIDLIGIFGEINSNNITNIVTNE